MTKIIRHLLLIVTSQGSHNIKAWAQRTMSEIKEGLLVYNCSYNIKI